MTPAFPQLRAEVLAVGYFRRRPVLEGVSLAVNPGELVLLRGDNGAGKSTLLRTLAGLLSPLAGEALLDGRPVATIRRRELARRMAFLPQQTDASALVGASVGDVAALGRHARGGWLAGAAEGCRHDSAVDRALTRMGLEDLAERDATSLSGGEERRMYIAACLAQEAPLLLLDEPFDQLDAEGRRRLADVLREHLDAGGAAVLATHDETPLRGLPFRVVDVATLAPDPCDVPESSTPARRIPLRRALGVAAALAAVAVLAASLATDSAAFTPEQFGKVLRDYRLPRLLTAFFVGGILSVAGHLYQTVFRNPMASPYTLGTASGAAFGAYAAVAVGGIPLPPAAFAGAILSIAAVRLCAGRGGAGRLLLSGIACGFFFSAASMFLQYRLDPERTFGMVHWGYGAISAAGPGPLALLGAAFAAALASGLAGRPLDALLAGDDAAASFGVPVRSARMAVFLFAAFLTACAVSVCGPVGFVGLVVPHFVRLVAPGRHAATLPAAAVFGGLFLALCDTLPRVLLDGLTPPVGIVTALVGAPVLLVLLRRASRR